MRRMRWNGTVSVMASIAIVASLNSTGMSMRWRRRLQICVFTLDVRGVQGRWGPGGGVPWGRVPLPVVLVVVLIVLIAWLVVIWLLLLLLLRLLRLLLASVVITVLCIWGRRRASPIYRPWARPIEPRKNKNKSINTELSKKKIFWVVVFAIRQVGGDVRSSKWPLNLLEALS